MYLAMFYSTLYCPYSSSPLPQLLIESPLCPIQVATSPRGSAMVPL